MPNIYRVNNDFLYSLLEQASSNDGATVLIPDIQRPYIWEPRQVVKLVDSLIRGWPFGTLLMWSINTNEVLLPYRGFWQVVDRTTADAGVPVQPRQQPAPYKMVLDGQQRIQSLLLATCGDPWSIKMDDSSWKKDSEGQGRPGRSSRHWSKAGLCFNVEEFEKQSREHASIKAFDFERILCWIVTDQQDGFSNTNRPDNYAYPLNKAWEEPKRYIRFSRLWNCFGPGEALTEADFRTRVRSIFNEHNVSRDFRLGRVMTKMGEFMAILRDVKNSEVTYLELIPHNNQDGTTRAEYNEAVVNIFTRLNTAGRTLSREDIMLAWLKNRWPDAGNSISRLREELLDNRYGFKLTIEQLVNAISILWSVTGNNGNYLNDRELLHSDILGRMAEGIETDWENILSAIKKCMEYVFEHELEFGNNRHYASVNSLALLWGWWYLKEKTEQRLGINEPQRVNFQESCIATFKSYLDRWLVCSNWADIWGRSSDNVMKRLIQDLSEDWRSLQATDDLNEAQVILRTRINTMVESVRQRAMDYINTLGALDRVGVGEYLAPLWIWHRLEENRWRESKIPLRISSKRSDLHVDHTVSVKLWEEKLRNNDREITNELLAHINSLGNCSLLESNFNISKSDNTLRSFIGQIAQFQNNLDRLNNWADSLDFSAPLLDPNAATIEEVIDAIQERDRQIRDELFNWINGDSNRIDIDLEL